MPSEITPEMEEPREEIQCPICPYCGQKTIAVARECSDESGWMCGWTCCCEGIHLWEKRREKMYG